MHSVVILSAQPANDRDLNRFGFFELQRLGWEVVFLDFSVLARSKKYLDVVSRWNQPAIGYPNIIRIRSVFELFNFIKSREINFCFNFLGDSWIERFSLFILEKKFIVIDFYLGGYPGENLNLIEILKYQWNDKKKIAFFLWLFEACVKKAMICLGIAQGLRRKRFNVIGGRQFDNLPKKICAVSFDYDNYKKLSQLEYNPELVVILDDGGPTHTDKDFRGVSFKVDWSHYYSNVNLMVRKIRAQTNCDIVISTHPRADLECVQSFFPDTEVSQGNSFGLIKNAKAVVTYDSTLISFAVACKKPMVLYRFELLGWFASHTLVREKCFAGFQRELGLQVILESNLDEIDFNELFAGYDPVLYKEYLQNYACHPEARFDSLWPNVSAELRRMIGE